MSNLIAVDVLQDNKGNWYLIPVFLHLKTEFYEDIYKHDNLSKKNFENKYGEYRIDSDINEGPQLYANINIL